MERCDLIKSLYIHFPFCRHLCNYCDFYKIRADQRPSQHDLAAYHHNLEQSFTKLNALLHQHAVSWGPLDTLYLGGGTPSLWGEIGFKFLSQLLAKHGVKASEQAEITLEVNPGSWTQESLDIFQAIGGNRFSIGLQSLDARFLKWLDRVHSLEDSFKTMEYFADLKQNYSVDLMLGLPYSKAAKRNVLSELEQILSYHPQHISLYILTTGDSYPHRKELPDEDWIQKEYLDVSLYLRGQGFEHYEVSNFATPGKRSEHNMQYWKAKNMGALGPSATGFLVKPRLRYKWKVNAAEYVTEELTADQLRLEELYLALRLADGVLISKIFKNKEIELFTSLARQWEAKGLGRFLTSDRFALNSAGFIIMDSLLGEVFSQIKSL